jgi:mannose-6-phosphate isomerase
VLEGAAPGDTVETLWTNGLADCAGYSVGSGFPWLIKWLDVADRLSVQVHPNDEQARRMLGQPCGKSEAWLVVHAEPTATVYAGLQPGVTAADVRQALQHGAVAECLHAFTPQAGDCIYLPAGTVHAAGGGLLLAEVQQPSDATFRLFDWNRLGPDGQRRALHIDQALECMAWTQGPVRPLPLQHSDASRSAERLLESPQFVLSRRKIQEPTLVQTDQLSAWMVLDDAVELHWPRGRRTFQRGNTVLLPPPMQQATWQPVAADRTATLLCISPRGG